MIPIKHKDLDLLAQRHFEAIKEYFFRKNTEIVSEQDFYAVDKWIKENIETYNFEKVIKAKPNELDFIVNLLGDKKEYPDEVKNLIKLYKAFANSEGNFEANKEKYNGFILIDLFIFDNERVIKIDLIIK